MHPDKWVFLTYAHTCKHITHTHASNSSQNFSLTISISEESSCEASWGSVAHSNRHRCAVDLRDWRQRRRSHHIQGLFSLGVALGTTTAPVCGAALNTLQPLIHSVICLSIPSIQPAAFFLPQEPPSTSLHSCLAAFGVVGRSGLYCLRRCKKKGAKKGQKWVESGSPARFLKSRFFYFIGHFARSFFSEVLVSG